MSSGTQRQHRNTFGVLVQLLGAGEGSKCIQESQGDVWVGKRNYLGIVQWIFCWLSGGKEVRGHRRVFLPGESSYSSTLKGNLGPGTIFFTLSEQLQGWLMLDF